MLWLKTTILFGHSFVAKESRKGLIDMFSLIHMVIWFPWESFYQDGFVIQT